jgi:sugar (pentulose or hexulose) kinase
MAIDGGTEAIKVGIYDAEGREISSASSSYPTFFQKPGWAEQDPNSWW